MSTPATQPRAAHRRPRSRGRALLLRLIVLGFGLLVGLVVAEIGLRVAGWPVVGNLIDGKRVNTTQRGGAEGSAYRGLGRDLRLVHFDYDVRYTLNRHGFAEREPAPKAPGERRIGLFGDSFTMGMGVRVPERFGDVWFAQVRDRLPAGTTLWNFGMPGTGTLQQAALLGGAAREYDLDELVLAFYSGNDVTDNIEESAHDPGAAGLAAPPRENPLRAWAREHVRLSTFLWYYGLRAFSAAWWPNLYTPETLDQLWPPTQRGLEQFLAAAGGRPVTIWYIPSALESSDEAWRAHRDRHGLSDAGRFLLRDRVRDWAAANGAGFVDLTDALRAHPLSETNFRVDPHWRPLGHRAAAGALARREDLGLPRAAK